MIKTVIFWIGVTVLIIAAFFLWWADNGGWNRTFRKWVKWYEGGKDGSNRQEQEIK